MKKIEKVKSQIDDLVNDPLFLRIGELLAEKFNNEFCEKIKALDLMKLLFFNDPIPQLHTHSYGFNTATGRNIIETLKYKYYEYEKN